MGSLKRPCVVHGWGNTPTELHRPKGPRHRAVGGEEGREEEEDNERCITVVTGPIEALMIHRMACIFIGPWGQPQGPLAPRTETPPPSSPTLAAPLPPPLVLPSPEVGPSGSGTLPKLLSPCGNQVLRRFPRFTTLSSKGRAPGFWDLTAGPSH
jgi:hypothetical protein